MKIIVARPGYRPIHPLAEWAMSQLLTCPEPKFFPSNQKPIAAIDVARNIIASDFFRSEEFDSLLFLDDDIVFDPKDMVKLAKHIEDGKSVVGAAYATKSKKPSIAARFFDNQTVEFNKDSKPVKIKYLPGGCIMISRKVLGKLVEKLPLCNFSEPISFWPFFQPMVKHTRMGIFKSHNDYLTEDYSFMERAQESGFDIWLDPSIRLSHVGTKLYTLESVFDEEVKEMSNIKITQSSNKNGGSPIGEQLLSAH